MSWQEYVDDHLMTPGHMKSAGIFGLDGNAWAVSGDSLTKIIGPHEIVRLINIVKGGEQDVNGIKLGGESYLHLTHDCGEQYIMLSRINAQREEDKFLLAGYLSNQCFILGVVVGKHLMGNCSVICAKLRDYLKSVGY